MKTAIIIQARMGSTRLPGKVLRALYKQPLLVHVIHRALACQEADSVLVATTPAPMDEVIADWSAECGVGCFRGNPDDVLDRYLAAARSVQADIIVRITADCPFIDPSQVDCVIRAFKQANGTADYATNLLERRIPHGLETEVFSIETLELMHREAFLQTEREHVTLFIHNQPAKFSVISVRLDEDLSHHRWTVDTIEDLQLVRLICQALYETNPIFGLSEILEVVKQNPSWSRINSHIQQVLKQPVPEKGHWKKWVSTHLPPGR